MEGQAPAALVAQASCGRVSCASGASDRVAGSAGRSTSSPRSACPSCCLPSVYPAPWTPADSLVVQGVLTQELDFTSTPGTIGQQVLGALFATAICATVAFRQRYPATAGVAAQGPHPSY